MTRPIRISVIADADKARKEITSVGTTLKRALGAGVALAAGAGVKELLGSINRAASDAQQSVGASESVFKQYADTVIERSKSAADAVGLSANEYRELANVSGAMLKNAGTPLKRVTDLTDKLTRRAADLAATYGGTTRDAIESVNSLLRGEADPIERYGVSIKQSDVNARLAAKGLDKLTGSAKKQADQQARLELLFQQTKDAAGQFGREADTAQGQQQRFNAELEDAKAAIGTAFLPVLTDLTKFARREVVPMLEDFAGWLGENQDEIRSTASEIGGNLLPALEATGDVLGLAVDAAKALPEPLRGIVLQAGLAALALPKVSAAATTMNTTLTNTVTRLRDAETRSAAMGSALRTAAGIGGMVALTQGAQSSNNAIKVLASTAGGALLGFSVGGPIGAAVGGAGGLASAMLSLKTQTDKANEAIAQAKAEAEAYKGTLDQVTGAITEQTRAAALKRLQDTDLIKVGTGLGLTQRQLVNAALGQEAATRKLNNALFAQGLVFDDSGKAVLQYDDAGRVMQSDLVLLSQVVADNTRVTQDNAAKVREQAAATRNYGDTIKTLPKGVQVYIENNGIEASVDGIAKVVRKARELAPNLSRRDIKTIITASGADVSVKEILRVVDAANDAPKKVREGGKRTGKAVTDGATEGLVPGLKAFKESLTSGTKGAADKAVLPARTGGKTVGLNLGAGMYGGLDAWVGPIQAKAYQMVRNAIAAANAAGDVHSPSRETTYTGRMLGEGLAVGMDSTVGRVRGSAKNLIGSVLAGVTQGSAGVDAALDALTKQIERAIKPGKGKNAQKREEKREKAVLKGLKAQFDQLRANGAEQDRINALLGEQNEQQETAYDKLRAAKEAYKDYADTIQNTITATGDVTQLGRQDDGTVAITSLLNELENKAVRAERFQSLMQQLADQGLSREAVDQMLAAGPEAALATAEAIASGGQAAVDQINVLQGRLDAAGAALGKNMADRYYLDGVNAAQGLVNGLLSQLAAVQAAADALAAALASATKKKLKIKSPSRVFKEIGKNITDGLTIGVDDTRATRAGASLAQGLTRGFGTPALDAVASLAGGSGGQEITVRVTAEQVSLLQQGREIQMKLDYARSNGVIGTTF